jgi:hypothetical protein
MTKELSLLPLDPAAYRLGPSQQAGPLAVLPVFGPDADGRFEPPLSGLKLSAVKGYGNLELANAGGGVAIVPLHTGYIQHEAQNHALCRSALLGPGQKVMFRDACCVQQAQGGYLEGREQWFFILPLPLRAIALSKRGLADYSKLWRDIAALNRAFGHDERGHLELILSRRRATLTQYQSRLELLPDQTGAVIFLNGRVVGLELAPSAAYFAEVWMPLACFCYGTAAMLEEGKGKAAAAPALGGRTLAELRGRLADRRDARQRELVEALAKTPSGPFAFKEEERYVDLRLLTATSPRFAGQVVEERGRVVYASLTAVQ